MDRAMREEMKALSRELLGASSRYQKLINKPNYVKTKDPITGVEYKVASYMNEEQVLEFLKQIKKEKEEKEKLEEVQELAGNIGNE